MGYTKLKRKCVWYVKLLLYIKDIRYRNSYIYIYIGKILHQVYKNYSFNYI